LELLTQEYLLSRLSYDPETGLMYWREHPAMSPQWNGRYAGKEAFTSSTNGAGSYKIGQVDGRKYFAHRIIYKLVHGYVPVQVDHINRVRTDNRVANLRASITSDNCKNKAKHSLNKSGFNGVYWCASRNRWVAGITVNYVKKHLGRFHTKEEAIAARISANAEHGFDPSHGA
jgi:hypothetical protein